MALSTEGFRSTRNFGTLFLTEGAELGGSVVLPGIRSWSGDQGSTFLEGCEPMLSAVVGSHCQRNSLSRPEREGGWGPLAPFGGMPRRAGSFLRSGEAAGYLEGIFVRKSGIGR